MDRQELLDKAAMALEEAKCFGAQSAEVVVRTEKGFMVDVRNAAVETLEHHQEHGLVVTVFHNQRSGSASTSDLSAQAISSAVTKACSIAQFTGIDEFAGLADASRLAKRYPDLSLCHPWHITPAEAITMAIECERVALQQDKRIKQCEAVSVNNFEMMRVYANSLGFIGDYPLSYHSMSCSLLAEQDGCKERDYEHTAARRPRDLDDMVMLAKHAAEKTTRRLGAKKIKTQKCPILFHAPVAKGLLASFVGAISGGSLYRKASFLVDHLGKAIFPSFVHIFQEPHLRAALGSAPFDSEGVATQDLDYVKEGILQHYVLGSYSARKLGMQTTGNAGGVFNLTINHGEENLHKLMQRMGTGLFVTELMGQGVNLTNGDYSRGAFGYWVENGEIQHPVHEVTIAGNLRDMFAQLVAVANDTDTRGNVRTGSMLLAQMTVAGY